MLIYKTTQSKVSADFFILTCVIECKSAGLLDENMIHDIAHFISFYICLTSSRNKKTATCSTFRADNGNKKTSSWGSRGYITLLLLMPTRIALRAAFFGIITDHRGYTRIVDWLFCHDKCRAAYMQSPGPEATRKLPTKIKRVA